MDDIFHDSNLRIVISFVLILMSSFVALGATSIRRGRLVVASSSRFDVAASKLRSAAASARRSVAGVAVS